MSIGRQSQTNQFRTVKLSRFDLAKTGMESPLSSIDESLSLRPANF